MSTKECPSCGTMVPESATRCKNCFHDFDEEEVKQSFNWAGPLALLGAFAAMAVIGTGTLYFIVSQPLEEKILVDENQSAVIWTRQYRSGPQTQRLRFSDIDKLEYVVRSNGGFEIAAISKEGERHIIHEGRSPLKTEAAHYAEVMEKPLEEIDNTGGFHKMND